jgi:GrpB-like predicted nucleotidyltransferase (UPF0157 family)
VIQRVFLKPHEPHWAARFVHESSAIAEALGDALASIHHIGSTAIPGIHAKPIIDMLAVTHHLQLLDHRSPRLAVLGYEALGEFGIPGRRYFRKSDPTGERTHQIHAFQIESPQITRHIAFRDYLRAYPEIASEYEALKLRLAAAHPHDIDRYTDGKDAFIQDIDARAAEWLARQAPTA